MAKTKTYQLLVELPETEPKIWRRFLVEDSVTLSTLHKILQVVMGWEDKHLYQFVSSYRPVIPPTFFGNPEDLGSTDVLSDKITNLNTLLKGENDAFVYEYDLGDSWTHRIILEKIIDGDLDN